MPIPVIAADSTRWGGTVTVRRSHLVTAALIRQVQRIVPHDPNRVAWIATYTTPGIGVAALPLAIVEGTRHGTVSSNEPAQWVLRANGDFIEFDVRIDSDMAIREFSGWWMPTFTPDTKGEQYVSIWEYIRVHTGETPESGA